MISCLLLLIHIVLVDSAHFNGGTIRWIPVNPYDNSTTVTIDLIQSYWWTFPLVRCASDVPISTSVYSAASADLTCVANCLTDGGYSNNTISIITDCVAASSAVGVMISQRSVSINLTAGAYFYVGYMGAAWRTLNGVTTGGSSWSIVSFIDLRFRPDGFINTPPTARVISPQYVIVNQIAQISIFVADVNVGDNVRCRWATSSGVTLVNECGGICYPAGVPPTSSLSNCTLTFQGSITGSWYAAAVQVRPNEESSQNYSYVIFLLGRGFS